MTAGHPAQCSWGTAEHAANSFPHVKTAHPYCVYSCTSISNGAPNGQQNVPEPFSTELVGLLMSNSDVLMIKIVPLEAEFWSEPVRTAVTIAWNSMKHPVRWLQCQHSRPWHHMQVKSNPKLASLGPVAVLCLGCSTCLSSRVGECLSQG